METLTDATPRSNFLREIEAALTQSKWKYSALVLIGCAACSSANSSDNCESFTRKTQLFVSQYDTNKDRRIDRTEWKSFEDKNLENACGN